MSIAIGKSIINLDDVLFAGKAGLYLKLMTEKKILWLCSWYPGNTEPFNGDFVQRQARAASLYNDVYVIHVMGDATGMVLSTEEERNKAGNLSEHIIYFKKKSSFFGKIAAQYRWHKLFKAAVKKYIAEKGKPDLVHVHIPFKAGIVALWIKRKYAIPYIVTEHWGIYNDVAVDGYKNKNLLFKYYTRKIIRKAVRFISVSRYLAKGINELVVTKEFDIIPNVVDTGIFHYNEKPGIVFRFIHVSNMVPLKNAEGILRAFQLLLTKRRDVELVMVGDTSSAIREYATALKLPGDNIIFKGEVSYEQVAKEMQQHNAFILNSHIENSPCVIGEALCSGLPVIATAVGGVPELLDDRNSILIPPGNDKELAAAMEQMIIVYHRYNRQKIAEEATNKFSYRVVGSKLDAIYKSLAGR